MNNQSTLKVIESVFEALDRSLEQDSEVYNREVGIVESVGEGIAQVKGLPNVRTDELVIFPNNVLGLIYNLDPEELGVILLDEEQGIEAGDEVMRTGKLLEVPVGDVLLGRVVDALGRPLDNKKDIHATTHLPVERPAPAIMQRAPVKDPLQTGILSIDALIPIGRGQRELILGDRQTGKTAIAVDTIINQKEQDVICIYCAIGKQRTAVNRVVADLQKNGAMEYSIVVSASSSTPAGIQFIAPYAATSMAEYFMDQGRDVLIVYDDLTWHARAYRELALLLRRPPAREAYPGDIFYIHARLLERATHLKPEHGGGSITALPIIETQSQDISAFIPTNLISITDGQIYLSQQLFQKDVLPAIDVGMSVSRVGGAVQLEAYRSVANKLKLNYSQFEEMEAFARFSSRLDENTRQLIERGKRIREVLKQPQFDTLKVAEQIEILRAVTGGLLDEIPPNRIAEAKKKIRTTISQMPPDTAEKLQKGLFVEEQKRTSIDTAVQQALQEIAARENQEETHAAH